MKMPFNMKKMRAIIAFAALGVAMSLCQDGNAQQPAATESFDVKAHYDKSELMITMRDGVKLYTVIYSPKDKSQKYPILLVRSPYSGGPYGPDQYMTARRMAPSEDFLRAGYIFVFQDGRGTHNSEGEWINLRPIRTDPKGVDESTDAYDSIDWLVKNVPGNNGRVGQWGISHPGWYTVMGLIGAHPALRAVSPQATTFDPFVGDDDHRNGAFELIAVEWWYEMSVVTGPGHEKLGNSPVKRVDYGTPWNYQFFLGAGPIDKLNQDHFGGGLRPIWQNLIEHPDYDEFWQSRNMRRHLGHVRIPVLNVMGWFDAYDPYGAMATYHAIEERNPRNQSTLVAGPWSHGGWRSTDGSRDGDIQFGSKTAEYYQKEIVFPFFEHYLRRQGDWSPAEAIMFETGNNRWRRFDQWPPKNVAATAIYLQAGGKLSFESPGGQAKAYDSYVSDPAHPVPYASDIRAGWTDQTHMTADQRYAYSRPDVLTYQTDALTDDVTVAGPIPVDLFVSTTGTDSDWFVKLIDVYPADAPDNKDDPAAAKMAGYQMLLGSEVMRGKYRNSLSSPQPMVPEQITPIHFEIRDKFHTFKQGHRIMVQVQSTWFPKIDRNPQVFTNIYRATPDDYRVATQKIYRFGQSASHLVLPVIPPLAN
jgi:putative CocE/NonD family hydrolase